MYITIFKIFVRFFKLKTCIYRHYSLFSNRPKFRKYFISGWWSCVISVVFIFSVSIKSVRSVKSDFLSLFKPPRSWPSYNNNNIIIVVPGVWFSIQAIRGDYRPAAVNHNQCARPDNTDNYFFIIFIIVRVHTASRIICNGAPNKALYCSDPGTW